MIKIVNLKLLNLNKASCYVDNSVYLFSSYFSISNNYSAKIGAWRVELSPIGWYFAVCGNKNSS